MGDRHAVHLIAADGIAWCNKVPGPTLRSTTEPERATCRQCLAAYAKGSRGRADLAHVPLTVRAAWDPTLHEAYTRWALHGGRYFKAWRVQPWDKAKDRSWHVEEVTETGEPAGYASLDPRFPGERRVVWVGGLYARAADLDEVRRIIREATTP